MTIFFVRSFWKLDLFHYSIFLALNLLHLRYFCFFSTQYWLDALFFFRRAKRSLFAQGRVKIISFFSRPWHPSTFRLFISNILGIKWSELSRKKVFSLSTLCTRNQSLPYVAAIFGRAERSLFAQGQFKMVSLLFPSVPYLSVSTLLMHFSRNLLVEFIQFLYKHYDGFTIYHFPKFGPPKFCFSELLAKNLQFSDFLESKGYVSLVLPLQ